MSQEQIDAKPAEDAALTKALDMLGEHFDCVLILASTLRSDDGGTTLRTQRRGNYYAAKGMVVEFMENSAAQEIAEQVTLKNKEEQ